MRTPLNRRTFLRGSGVAMALPMLEAMIPRARAAGA
ncbi:MAG: twin-arginine translocation signal domain-containing protein, partial [Roseibacillus sp.]